MLTVNSSKTFDEILVENPNLYDNIAGYTWDNELGKWVNTGVSDITKTLIEDWFGLRKICDDDRFERFFRRKMNVTALRYAQLSRIELSAFDPLVEDYVEKEILSRNERESSGISNKQTSGTTSGTTGSETTRTPNLTEVIDRDTTGTRTNTNSGNDTQQHQGTHAETDGGTDTQVHDRTKTSADGGSDTRQHTGDRDTEYSGSDTLLHDGERENVQTGTETTTKTGSNTSESVQAQKNAPMSIEYAGATAGTIPNLNWGSMTSQAQSKTTGSESETDSVTSRNTDAGEDSSTDVTRYGKTEEESDSATDITTYGKTGRGTESGTDTTRYGKTESVTESGTDTTTYGKIENGTESGTEDQTTTQTGNERTVVSGTSSGTSSINEGVVNSGSESGSGETHEIWTGRHGLTPQEAFEKAVSYLKTSSAFEWLAKELEECFMCVYDI